MGRYRGRQATLSVYILVILKASSIKNLLYKTYLPYNPTFTPNSSSFNLFSLMGFSMVLAPPTLSFVGRGDIYLVRHLDLFLYSLCPDKDRALDQFLISI